MPLLFCCAQLIATAQQHALTVREAVQRALDKYPAVRSSMEQVSAAAAGINLARTNYLPRADFLGQVNRATHNNVFGQLFPQSVIPLMTGPALGTNSANNVWGSAVGVLVSWEPIDFGLRAATVNQAKATRDRATADMNVTKLQVAATAADAFLTIAAAEQTVIAANAGVHRAQALEEVIGTLAKNELRPGADASRAQAELALSRTQQIQAEQARNVAYAALAALLGITPQGISLEARPLLTNPPESLPEIAVAQHPLAIAGQAVISEAKSRERVLNRSYYPRVNLQSAAFARGTGVQPDGQTGGPASGLGPNVQNWAVGASISFPAFDWFSIHQKKQIEAHSEQSAQAKYDQTLQDLNGEVLKAKAVLDGARRIALNTPIQLQAARATEQQATARYKAGLGNIAEVAEAERLLTQAEIDNSLAQLGVWRAQLGVAAAEGDLTPFLDAAK